MTNFDAGIQDALLYCLARPRDPWPEFKDHNLTVRAPVGTDSVTLQGNLHKAAEQVLALRKLLIDSLDYVDESVLLKAEAFVADHLKLHWVWLMVELYEQFRLCYRSLARNQYSEREMVFVEAQPVAPAVKLPLASTAGEPISAVRARFEETYREATVLLDEAEQALLLIHRPTLAKGGLWFGTFPGSSVIKFSARTSAR